MSVEKTGVASPVWQARIATALNPAAKALNDSLPIDQRLWPEEVALTNAYAHSLLEAGVIDKDELSSLLNACQQIEVALRQGRGTLEGEDIHSAIESEVTRRAPKAGQKLHTGRSRNDQVSTLLRMHVMRLSEEAIHGIRRVEAAILQQARKSGGQIVAAHTHLQPAQPVLLAHWWLAHSAALERDETRFGAARLAADQMTLGAGAVAGSPLNYDRLDLATRLGFSRLASNSIDAVGDRDFVLEYLQAATQLGLHVSRLAEDLILACSPGMGWFRPPDGFSTGSSLLPQKRNPDLFELMRGKSARLISNAERLSILLKGLPTSYQKDLQEDKEALFDTADTLTLILSVLPDAILALQHDSDRMTAALTPELTAVDLVDALIEKGIAFREAHAAVGKLYAKAEELGLTPRAIPHQARIAIHDAFSEELLDSVDCKASVERRNQSPGTGPVSVERQISKLGVRLGLIPVSDETQTDQPDATSLASKTESKKAEPEPVSRVVPTQDTLKSGEIVTIRRALLSDVPGIAKAMAQYVADDVLLARPLGELYQSIREFYVAVHDGQIVGCGALRLLWDGLGEVRSLAILPPYQGKGMGGMIVRRLLDEAIALKLPRVIALTKDPQFFESWGFHRATREKLPRKIWADCVRCPKRHSCDEIAVEKILVSEEELPEPAPAWDIAIPPTASTLQSTVPVGG